MQTFRRNSFYGSPASMRGVGLVEVLVAVLVLAIGLLGIAALQATTLRNSQSSIERTQAVMQTYTILDAMRGNVIAARLNKYDMALTCTPPALDGTLITSDKRFWLQTVQANLGSTACGSVVCPLAPLPAVCTITVQWDDSRGTGDKVALTTQTLLTTTRI